MKYTLYQESRIGGRKNNQDRIGHAYTKEAIVMVLADGMGGHAQGEVAAQHLVDVVLENFMKLANPTLVDPAAFLFDAIYRAHEAINAYAANNHLRDTPRTTCVVCVVQSGKAIWAHVGDSRLYHFGRVVLRSRTLDHSAVQQRIDEGTLTEEQTYDHPDRNKLYSCVGGGMLPSITVSSGVDLREGDILLMASDGLWAEFKDSEMLNTLNCYPLRQALTYLCDHAEYRAGEHGDNLSLIGLRCGNDLVGGHDSMSDLGLEGFTTELRQAGKGGAVEALSDVEIDDAIAEIHAALEKHQVKR